MKVLPPIPTPLRQRLKPIRQKWVPMVVLLVVFVAIALIWRRMARPTSFVGMVETVQTIVTTPDAGMLTNISINPLQEVVAGDVVAEVMTTDPRTANNRLSVLRGKSETSFVVSAPAPGRYAGMTARSASRSGMRAAIRVGIEARPAERSASAAPTTARSASGSRSDSTSRLSRTSTTGC